MNTEKKPISNRIALIGLIVEQHDSTDQINQIVRQYRDYIVGRMGLPHVREEVSVISLVIDAPEEITSAFSGKLGMLPGVTCKTIYSKASTPTGE